MISTTKSVVAIRNKRKWFKVGPAKNHAQRVLAEKIHEINEGTFRDYPKIRFEKFARSWLSEYARI